LFVPFRSFCFANGICSYFGVNVYLLYFAGIKRFQQRKNDEVSNCFSEGKILIMSFNKLTAWKVNLRIEKPARSVMFCLWVRIVSSSIGSLYTKRLFIWRWGTLGRWGNSLRWGKAITLLYMHSYNPAIPGALSQDYWMVAKHVNKKNAGKPRVLAINGSSTLTCCFTADVSPLRETCHRCHQAYKAYLSYPGIVEVSRRLHC